jgi:hypothetical protein
VGILGGNGIPTRSFDNVNPDPKAEDSVGGLNFYTQPESELSSSCFELVMGNKSEPLLARKYRVSY